ncbi:hypothetical protein ACNTMW_22685 [Planosporangium sp. 12N6]|uniref:hypothetical protein n=1 Tax=Planosporangium spinosum TaxID=3402278 RepID=UPI003CF7F30C
MEQESSSAYQIGHLIGTFGAALCCLAVVAGVVVGVVKLVNRRKPPAPHQDPPPAPHQDA